MNKFRFTEFKDKRIKYLVIDIERRQESNTDFIMTSVSMIGMNRSLQTIFHHDVFLADSLKCDDFVGNVINKEFLSTTNYMAYTWKPEWFVENLFESLQYGRDGNIEIVAHNANFDQKVFEKLFKDHDYPFFWNDKEFKNGNGKEGLFSHNVHDTRLVGQLFRVHKQQTENVDSKSTLGATAEALGITVQQNLLHCSRYDCYLTSMIFLVSQEILECYKQSKIVKISAANNLDYKAIYEIESESESEEYEEIFAPPIKKEDK